MRRRERGMPLELDDHVLRDVGLTRVEYCFLHMSRATTAPELIAKTAGIFTISRRLLCTFQP
jgi:hypothetical protein